MEAGPAGTDAVAGWVRWAPVKSLWLLGMSWWVLRGLECVGLVRRLALPADLPHRPSLEAWPTPTLSPRSPS
jgi:hypothetical protein